MLYGAASPIPGISGGTLFVFFNIYEDFFHSASFANVKKNVPLLIAFLLGSAVGLLGISQVIMHLLTYYEQIMYFSFIGLILGCIPMIYKKTTVDKIKRTNVAIFIIALSFMIFLALMGGEVYTNVSLEQLGGVTPAIVTWVFIASFISAIAMLIPGVGGSIMMLAFGIYTIYIEALSTLDPLMISVLLISMALGILAGIKIIKNMLVSRPQTLYGAILGFIIGSIFIVFPGFSMDLEGLLSIIFMVACTILAYRLTKKTEVTENPNN